MSELVVCESAVAVVPHLRRVTKEFPIKLSGHWPRPLSLCGSEVAWDTKLPLSSARCRDCLSKSKETP